MLRDDAEPAPFDPSRLLGLDGGLRVDTSEKGTSFLVVAENGSHIRLSEVAYRIVSGIAAGVSCEDLAAELRRSSRGEVTASDVASAYERVTARISAIAAKPSQGLPAFFWLRVRFLPEALVAWVASRLAILYHPVLVAGALVWIAAALAIVVSSRGGFGLQIERNVFGPAYGLFLLSLVAHEFGHASACARYGARPSDIGFAMYLIYPAFYSDVSSAWRLKRSQRVVVDLGGLFFQGIVGAAYALLYVGTGWKPLWGAFSMILYGALFCLNPIFKFDGYWMVADALGVTNLSQQPARILRELGSRLQGNPARAWPWPAPVVAILAVYSVLSFLVWGFFLVYLFPLLRSCWAGYPEQVRVLVSAFGWPPRLPAWSAAEPFLVSTLLFGFAVLMVVRASGVLWRLVRGEAG